jgi:HEAT repeat protein
MDSDVSDHALIDAMLREPDPTRQSKLIEELGNRRVIAAVEPLLQQVRLNAFQSGSAITALGQIGDPRAVGVLIECCRHQNLAWIAKDALARIGPPAVEPLIAALSHNNPDIRFVAVRTLGELGDPRAVAALDAMIENEPDETNRQLARSTLKNLLIDSLQSGDARVIAIEGLARLGDARTIEPLQTVADHDPDETVRQAAQDTILHLLHGVESDPFAAHQFPARSRNTNLLINRLGYAAGLQVESPADLADEIRTVTVLQETASSHPDRATCDLAREALRQLCVDYLRHPDSEARLVAVQGLGGLRDPGAERLLKQVAEYDPSDAVRQAAREALAQSK